MMDFESLPLELIGTVFCKLPGIDLAAVAQTCKTFQTVANFDFIWQKRCREEYGIGQEQLQVESYRVFYTKVLHPYGYLLGVWQPQMAPYGGLVKIKLEDRVIKACQYLAPPDPKVFLPLRTRTLFQVQLDEATQTKVECLKGPNGPHALEITSKSNDEFTVSCSEPRKHNRGDKRGNLDLAWIQEELGMNGFNMFSQNIELLRMKFKKLNEFDQKCSFKRLEPPQGGENMPIRPGLFKGTYGGHGIEIIYMTYDDNRLHGIKITGDPNVPANKKSVAVHLDEPMVLTRSQQESIYDISQLDKNSVQRPADDAQGQTSQPVCIPPEMHDRGMGALEQEMGVRIDRCIHRYFGSGLIALHGFREASRTPAHFIVFTEDIFALLWLELRSVSIYCRVQEDVWT